MQRRQSFGTKLMKEIVSLTEHWEADDIELSVSEFKAAAIRFYERLGFVSKSRQMELPLRSGGRS
ncbi:GNAT family N-acetyltransferase [Paenibacillus sp. alder61]|nr:GNAT family N-acetyltransferase [Paenibacillus sp. alder61]